MNETQNTPRWRQRFDNFCHAADHLAQPFTEKSGAEGFSVLEQQGLFQRFEIAFELGWKVLQDYLFHVGLPLDQRTPRNAIKQAFSAGIITDGQGWIDMLEERNLLSHTYDETLFSSAIDRIAQKHLLLLQGLQAFLQGKG